MKTAKYILTKYETVNKTEKVEYEVEIPEGIRNRTQYANDQVLESNYKNCKVVDIVNSELIDEEAINIRPKKRVKSNN